MAKASNDIVNSIAQQIDTVALQNGWSWARITRERGIEPDWFKKVIGWEMCHGWKLLDRLPNGTGFHPGRERKEVLLDTFHPGECDDNMVQAFKAGLIDEIWAGFQYEHGRWICHVWGFKDGVLADSGHVVDIKKNVRSWSSAAEEYFGVRVVSEGEKQ